MLTFTITGHPVVEPVTYTASNSGQVTYFATEEQTEGDIYYITNAGSTSGSGSQRAITSSNGDILQTTENEGFSSGAGTTIDDTVDTYQNSTLTTASEKETGLQSWDGRIFNSQITAVHSCLTNYTWNTGYKTQVYNYEVAAEGGSDTQETIVVTGTTKTATTHGETGEETTTVAATKTTTQSYPRTLNEGGIQSQGTTFVSTSLPPITLWQTSSVEATLVEYAVPYQGSSKTVSFTQYGYAPTEEGRTYTPITDTVGQTGQRGTHTVVILGSGETLWVPTATGVREAANLCQSFEGPLVKTLSGVYSTRNGLVVAANNTYEVTEQEQTLTRTVTTATLSAVTTLTNPFASPSTYTTQRNFKTRSVSVDGIVPFGNPTFWANPWPMKNSFPLYTPIPAQLTQTFTESEIVTTTKTEVSVLSNFGATPTDSAVVWKSVYFNTQTPESAWQSTVNSFVTESNTRSYKNAESNSVSETDETGGTTQVGAGGFTWVEHRQLSARLVNSNPLSASITYESYAQAPLSDLARRAAKVSIENTTITAWQPAAALWSVDFVAAVFPQTFSVENSSQSRTTEGSAWADGYYETVFDSDGETTFSGKWVAEGTPGTSWVQVGGFGNTGKNQRGDNWTRIRPPNILVSLDESGNTSPVTHQVFSTYAATAVENFQQAFAVEVNSTGGGQKFLARP